MRARRIARALILALALGAGAAPGGAVANEGSLYPTGPGASGPDAQFTQSREGVYFTVDAPELRPAHAGTKWEMTWGCPLPGTEISRIEWSGARGAAPSNLEMRVAAGGEVIWTAPDADMPHLSAGGQYYALNLAPGTCLTQLRLSQTATLNQHARTYVLNDPKVFVRDLTAPAVRTGALPDGWLAAGHAPLQVRWSASDNFGADGMGAHEVLIGEARRWAGAVGPGDHAVAFGLGDVPDGVHAVTVRVHGDGTPAGESRGTIALDRVPPAVGGTSASVTPRAGVVALAWHVTDATSGPAGTSVDANTAADGSTSGSWREIAGASAGSGRGEIDVTGLGEGLHAWRVRASDRAGNAHAATASGRVVVDLTPPSLTVGNVPTAWVRRATLTLDQADNLQGALGLGPTEIAVNGAPDGTAAGGWVPLVARHLGPGRHAQSLDLSGLASGRHLLRVRLRNGGALGASLVTERTETVSVDTTSPSVRTMSFSAAGAHRIRAAWHAHDGHSGVASAAVQWWNGGAWRTLATTTARNGDGSLTADSAGVPGTARLRVVVQDGAGNVSDVAGELGADGGPAVGELRLDGGPPWTLTWTQADPDGFGLCETLVQIAGPGGDESWRTVIASRRGAGPQRALVPTDGLRPGGYRVRVVACDADGNTAAAATGGLQVATGGSASGAGASPVASRPALDGARLDARLLGPRRSRRGVVMRTVRYGRTVIVAGRLRGPDDGGIGGVEIEVRDTRGRILGRGLTEPDGRFWVRARPEAGARLRVGVPVGGRLSLRSSGPALEVKVRPRIDLQVSARRVAAGAPVVFFGRIDPAPRRLGVARKSVVLEWLDPLRRVWRPVLITPLRQGGSFSATWRFNVRGLTVPMRVRVPVEGGWPLLSGTSRVIPVAVRG